MFWDTGKVRREGAFLLCESTSYGYRTRDWCEDGVQKAYFESGAR